MTHASLPVALPPARPPARPVLLARCRAWLGLVLACAWCAMAPAAPAPLDPVGEALRERIELLRQGERVLAGDEELVSHRVVPLLYEEAGLRPLWRDAARVEALLATIAGVDDDGLRREDYHSAALLRLWPEVRRDAEPRRVAEFDLLATDAFVLLLYHLALGKVDPVGIEPNWNFNPREVRDREALEFVRDAIASGRIAAAADAARPRHWMYEAGRRALAEHRAIAARGGWPSVPAGAKLEPGADDARVPALRRRLSVSGDWTGAVDDSTRYDDALVAAVRAFQRRHQLEPDGVVGPGTLRELNVPALARMDQIRLNLERARWVLHEIGDEDLVIVDIAGFRVRYVRERRTVFESRAIVGQPFRQTPVFRATIDRVIFNPTWTVPPGILAKDVLPGLKRGEDVLARKQLAVYDRSGRPVDPATIDWSRTTAANFPYVLRQAAGDANALGRVKIDFPNPHLVYLHDTPTRSLFDRDQRTFSSGCIRVERALELARLLLDDPRRWDEAAVRATVDAGATRTVALARRVPVLLIYWTVDQDEAGRVVFRRDVYGRDARLLRALDDRFRFGSRVRA